MHADRGSRSCVRSCALAVLGAATISSCALLPDRTSSPRPVVRGPVPTRVQHPLAWTLLQFRPRRPIAEPLGRVGVEVTSAYSSIFRNFSNVSEKVTIDGELWENAVVARAGVAPGGDLEVEVPVLYASRGFLDHFVDAWHSLFGFSDGLRNTRPDDAFEMDMSTGGKRVYHFDEDEPSLGDVPVIWTQEIVGEDRAPFALAVRGGLELPTGSESRGAGNGAFDWGGGFVAERSIERWTFFGGVDGMKNGNPSAFDAAGISLAPQVDAELGGEYRWNDSLSWISDLVFTSAMTHDFGLHVINRPILDLGVGAAWDTGVDSRWMLTFHEDLISNSGPDFGVMVTWLWRI